MSLSRPLRSTRPAVPSAPIKFKDKVAILGGTGPGQSFFDPLAYVPLPMRATESGGYTEITGVANTGRDGQDERVFRVGLRLSW